MISLEAICFGNWEAASKAAKKYRRPLLMRVDEWTIDLGRCRDNLKPWTLGLLPNLGGPEILDEFYPGQWDIIRAYFVDKTGWDLWNSGGPAMSVGELCEHGLEVTQREGELGWFLGDEGQFQLYVYAAKYVGGNGFRC